MKNISQSEYIKLLSRHARENNIPLSGSFELTPLCNLDCKMCYVHLQDASLKERLLSGKQYISVMKEAIAHGMVFVLLTGGEALTHPDFWEIYDFLQSAGVYVRLKTNDILLNEETVIRLSKQPPYGIDISLYGCDRESYLAVTGHDVFDTVAKNIYNAIGALLPVRLMITPSGYMSPWTDAVMAYAKSFNVPVVVNETLIAPYENTGRKIEDFDLPAEEYLRIAKKRTEMFSDLPAPDEDEERIQETADGIPVPEKGLRCGAGRSCFSMHWNGNMTACLSFSEKLVCADVQSVGFDEAWRKINSFVREYEIPKACLSCAHNQFCSYCPTRHGAFAERHECNTAFCELKKLLINDRIKAAK